MGSGPFIPTRLVKDVSVELERNPSYWKEGLPYIDGSIHYYIADKGTAIGAYRTGQVLMTNWPVTNLSNAEVIQLRESETDTLDVYLIPGSAFNGTLINTTIEPFNDVRVRQAMHLAVDRSEFRDIFGGGIAPIGTREPRRKLCRSREFARGPTAGNTRTTSPRQNDSLPKPECPKG